MTNTTDALYNALKQLRKWPLWIKGVDGREALAAEDAADDALALYESDDHPRMLHPHHRD